MKYSQKIKYIGNLLLLIAFAIVGISLFNNILDFAIVGGFTYAAVIPFVSLEHDEETPNMAGISTIAYVIRVSDLQTAPTTSGAPVNPEDLVTLIGNFVPKAGKYFTKLYSTQELGELMSEVDGPRDGEFFKITATFFYPHTNKKALGMAALFKTADVIIILKEFSGGGQYRVIGTPDLPARLKPAENSGKAFADQKGITYTVEASSIYPAFVYEGSIVTAENVVNSPIRLAVDAVTIDLAVGDRFVVGANTTAKTLTTINNATLGSMFVVEYDALSTGSLAYTDALGGSATLNSNGDWIRIKKATAGFLIDEFVGV